MAQHWAHQYSIMGGGLETPPLPEELERSLVLAGG